MKKKIIALTLWWLRLQISWLAKEYHLHKSPVRKISDFKSPMPEFTVDGGKNEN